MYFKERVLDEGKIEEGPKKKNIFFFKQKGSKIIPKETKLIKFYFPKLQPK